MRKLRVLLVTFAVVSAGTLVACGNDGGTKDSGTSSTSTESIKIGAVKALSGGMASFDIPALNGAKMAIEDINAAGGVDGRPLELLVADMHSDPQESGPAAKDLIDQGAEFIIAVCEYGMGAPAALAAQEANLVGMSDCASPIEFGVTGIGPLAYTMALIDRSEASAIAEFAINDKGWNSAWVLWDTSLLIYKGYKTGFMDRFQSLGGTIVGEETYVTDDPSISSQIAKLRNISPPPDVIFLAGMPVGGASAMRQLRAAGFDQPILAGNSYDGDFWKEAIPDISNMYYTNYASMYGDDPDPFVNSFFERYAKEFGAMPDNSNVVTGYAVIQAFAQAYEKAGTSEGDKLSAALDSMVLDLVVGPTHFCPQVHADPMRRMEIMQIQNGVTSFVKYWELAEPPAYDPPLQLC